MGLLPSAKFSPFIAPFEFSYLCCREFSKVYGLDGCVAINEIAFCTIKLSMFCQGLVNKGNFYLKHLVVSWIAHLEKTIKIIIVYSSHITTRRRNEYATKQTLLKLNYNSNHTT